MSAEIQLFSHDTELMVLSLLLKTPDRIYAVMDVLRGEMFSASIHGVIFNSMVGLVKDGVTLSPQNLKIYVEQHKLTDKTGGHDYIDMLASMDADEKSFELYYKALGDSYKGRTLLNVAANLPAVVKGSTHIDDVIGNLKQTIDSLNGTSLTNGVHSLGEILDVSFDKIQHRVENPGISGIKTGIPTIDEAIGGLTKGTALYIGARPSMGKTITILTMLKSAATLGHPSLFISREMVNEEVIERLLSMDTKIPYTNIRYGRLSETNLRKLKRSYNRLRKLPFYIDSNIFGDINYVTSIIRKFHRLYGIRVVGVDYIGLLAERDRDQTAELGRISRLLKLISVDLELTVIVVSQLNRSLEARDDKHPILSDLRQSGNLEEDADIVIGLYRDEIYNKDPRTENKIEFEILKNRNGPLGKYELEFNKECVSIIDATDKTYKFGSDDEEDK